MKLREGKLVSDQLTLPTLVQDACKTVDVGSNFKCQGCNYPWIQEYCRFHYPVLSAMICMCRHDHVNRIFEL